MFACPECGRMGLKTHDTVEKTWGHLNFSQHEAYLSAKVPRLDATSAESNSCLFLGLGR
jgi:transposase